MGTNERAPAPIIEAGLSEHNSNFIKAAAAMRPDAGFQARLVAGGWAVFHGIGSPLSRAIGVGMTGAMTASELDQLEEFYRSRGAPPRLEVCPLAVEPLHQLLAKRRYVFEAFISTHWKRPGLETGGGAPDVEVEEVTPRTLVEFADVMHAGFNEGGPPLPVFQDIPEIGLRTQGQRSYLARLDGRAAGGGAMGIVPNGGAPLALLFGGATAPPFRRRGVQGMLLARRLADAARAGCEIAVVQCRPGSASESNILRAGFRPAYTKVVLSAP